ncbi:MAG: ABC transporter ATP-binding protein [Flavisolibacter sp.]|nr:ABC transporter ATP-binding protein [Flavisolibacter sp.]
MDAVIEVQSISKRFKEVLAVDDLSFTVNRGEVYGFLGQNGAGKSTTIRMLLTLITPTSGTIHLFGKNLYHHRKQLLARTGAIIEKPDLYKYLTAFQNLKIMARLSAIQADEKELLRQLERVGIADRAHSKVKTYSQGMKQRLGIACALIHEPELIILDEPTNGLDPQGIADVRNLILHLSKNEKKTVVVSSHILSEIELIADSMLIIDKGRKVAEGKVSDLLNPANTMVEIETEDNEATVLHLQVTQWASQLQQANNKLLLRMHKKEIPLLIRELTDRGISILAVQPKHTLEDYFLSLTTSNQHVAAYQY